MKNLYEAKEDIPELGMVKGEIQLLHEETFKDKRFKSRLKAVKQPKETESNADESS